MREHLGLVAGSSLIVWYAVLAVAATVGWLVGRAQAPLRSLDEADDDRVYRFMTWAGAIGVLGMYALVQMRAPGLLVTAFKAHQFNLVREAVPMAPGVATLRYATIISGAIALHRLVILREKRLVHWLNLALLAANVLAASRLALIMSILVFAGLAVMRPANPEKKIAVRRGPLLLVVVAVLGILTLANYSRNATYYEVVKGTTNPISMMVSETVTYVGSPFQVAVATTHDDTVHPTGNQIVSGIGNLLTPTFFTASSTPGGGGTEWYRGKVSIESGLTTNSALAQVYGMLGLWALPAMALIFTIAGFVMGHLSRYRSYMALGAFVVGYCFAETWRIYLFSQGIVWFLMLALWFACYNASRKSPSRQRLREPAICRS